MGSQRYKKFFSLEEEYYFDLLVPSHLQGYRPGFIIFRSLIQSFEISYTCAACYLYERKRWTKLTLSNISLTIYVTIKAIRIKISFQRLIFFLLH